MAESLLATKKSQSRILADRLRKLIRQNKCPVGTTLPTTRELVDRYQVSRTTIQGALRELETQGWVRCLPRQGTIVKSTRPFFKASSLVEKASQVCFIRAVGSKKDRDQPPVSWSMRIIHAAERMFSELGLHCVTLSYLVEDGRESLLPRLELLNDSLAGIIEFNPHENDPALEMLDSWQTPWVTINRFSRKQFHNFVCADNVEGSRLVGRCFARLGLNRMLVLARPLEQSSSVKDKISGLLEGVLEESGQVGEVDTLWCEDSRAADVYQKTTDYLKTHDAPQVIFATGDILALAGIKACRDFGLDVPGQVGVVGATGDELARHCHPTLSVLTQPMESMGRQAAKMLVEMINSNTDRIAGRYLTTRFIIRQSLHVPEAIRNQLEAEEGVVFETDASL